MTTLPADASLTAKDVRSRIVAAATRLVAQGGSGAATTRAVAEAAAVQAPTIYRLFGDKDGLLEAVAEQTLNDFVAQKERRAATLDPVADLTQGWNDYIAFGLANPAVFVLMATRVEGMSKAVAAGLAVLRERVRRIALTGRLRVTEEQAVDLIHAMGTGTVLALIGKSGVEHATLSEDARKTVFSAIIAQQTPAFEQGPAGAASALRASLNEQTGLSPGERLLLDEWLERIARA
ncbi:TetR/AcrR family transcriptional regulator [Shinella sp.]|uniref:TetR/AcrR family transcriptional regulator n=1 Tax=Shinella sp. TaxID=1870904 RepID=UPI00301D8F9D